MITPQDIINKVFQGLDIAEEQKQQTFGAYLLAYYKKSFEVLIELKLTDQEFLNRLAEVFNSEVNRLSVEEKKRLDEVLEKSKGGLLANLLATITGKLDPATQQKVKDNIVKITQTPASK